MLFFENSHCMSCGMTVGYCLELAKIVTLQRQTGSSQGSVCEVFFPGQGCATTGSARTRATTTPATGWCRPSSTQQFCKSCAAHGDRSRISPMPATTHRVAAHRSGQAPAAVHAVCAQTTRELAPANGRTTGWRSASCKGTEDEPVMTGHDDGVITLNIDEADFAFRENMREKMGEGYRTVLGHLRHEIGHYYWDRLIRDDAALRSIPRAVRRRDARATRRPCSATTSRARRPTGPNRSSAPTPACIPGRTGPRPGRTTCTWSTRSKPREPRPERARAGRGKPGDAIATERLAFRDFESLIADWNAVTLALNSLNRSMGMKDAYPFVLSPTVLGQAAFRARDASRARRGRTQSDAARTRRVA